MAFLAATQLTDDFVLATQPDLAVETDSDPEENVILPPQQVGVLVVDTEQRIGVEEYPLFLGCNIIGRDITDIPGADEVRQERLRQWRNENLEVHVEAIFVSEPSLSKTHAHIYLEDGGLNCFVTALRTTNPSFIVPAGAASRAHTLSPGVRYNVRPDDVLRFGRLYCRVLCGPDWLAREQQQRQVRLQPWHGNGEAEYLRQGLDGRLAAEHRRGGSPQHLQYRLNQDDPWQQQQQQEQQQQGFRSAWSLSPGAVQRPSGAAISHNAAGSTEGLQAGREEECIGGLVSGGAAAGPVAGSPVTAAGADAVEGHTSHGSAGAPGQPRQQRIVPPTQDVSVGPLLQLPDGRHHEAWMPAPGLQQHRHGPLPVPVMKVIALVPPQGAGAAGALSGPDTLIAAAGAVGSGPPQTYGAGQPPGAVLVQLHGGATALLPGDASAAMLPLQVQMPFPLLQAVSETEEEEENEEEKELEEEKRKDVSTGRNAGPDGVVPRAGTITPADPPAPWWEVADSLDDTHDGAWGASQSTDKPGEADAYPRSPGPGGGAEALHPGVGEEAGDRSLQHPSRPLRVKLEPTEDLGGPQSANGAHASSAENLDEHRHPHYVEGDDRSICDGDAIMCDLTQPPDEEVLGVPGDGFAIADDAEAHAHIRKHQENQQQLVYNRTDLGPSLPILGPSPPQEPHSDDETAPPSPSPPSLSDAPNRVGASADGENLGKTGPDGCRIMASGGGDVRSHFLERIDSTGRALAERVPQVAVPAGAIVPPTQLVDGTSLVLPSTHAVMPPPPQQHPACPSHSLQKDSHQSRFGQVVQPQCPQQQRRRSHPEGGEEADPAVWGVHGLLGEAAGGRELLPDAVGGCRRLLLGILSDLSPSSSPNPESGSKAEGKPVSTDHHQPPEDLQSDHIPPLQHPLQRLEDQQQQLQPPLRPQTAVAMEALAKPPSPTPPHCKNAGAPTPLAAATATVGAGVAATAGIPAAGTEPPGTGPPASFYISQSASPWDMDAARQRVGRLVSLLCSTESSGPSQEELWQPLQLPQPPQPMQLPPGRNGAEDVVNLDGAVQEGPEPRANAVGMVAPSGRSMPLGLANEQPPPAQPQQLLRQQPPEQMDARDVVLLPPRAAGEMQSLTGAAANAEFLQQARLPPPSPALLGSPTVSVRSFMIPGFGTQIAADALHQLMMAESAPTGKRRQAKGWMRQRLCSAARGTMCQLTQQQNTAVESTWVGSCTY
ncbi:hypothetical protein Vretifemale_5997 [Volvox reticuliferus]|uniref:FHA domain-containing protein n=2 Tax=Volvox reticuliferus TaxID=1737510 RepID=A0A8J4C7V1_9CHLO|nr:hypothetical protein Vretifemale_5997 [Volvox reticuliferus]